MITYPSYNQSVGTSPAAFTWDAVPDSLIKEGEQVKYLFILDEFLIGFPAILAADYTELSKYFIDKHRHDLSLNIDEEQALSITSAIPITKFLAEQVYYCTVLALYLNKDGKETVQDYPNRSFFTNKQADIVLEKTTLLSWRKSGGILASADLTNWESEKKLKLDSIKVTGNWEGIDTEKNRISALNFSGKSLSDKFPSLAPFVGIRELNLNNNSLTFIPDLSVLPLLDHINLSNNKLSDAPSITGLTNLYELNLSNNKLDTTPVFDDKMTNLYIINLSNNNLTQVPDLTVLTKLSSVNLKDNPNLEAKREDTPSLCMKAVNYTTSGTKITGTCPPDDK